MRADGDACVLRVWDPVSGRYADLERAHRMMLTPLIDRLVMMADEIGVLAGLRGAIELDFDVADAPRLFRVSFERGLDGYVALLEPCSGSRLAVVEGEELPEGLLERTRDARRSAPGVRALRWLDALDGTEHTSRWVRAGVLLQAMNDLEAADVIADAEPFADHLLAVLDVPALAPFERAFARRQAGHVARWSGRFAAAADHVEAAVQRLAGPCAIGDRIDARLALARACVRARRDDEALAQVELALDEDLVAFEGKTSAAIRAEATRAWLTGDVAFVDRAASMLEQLDAYFLPTAHAPRVGLPGSQSLTGRTSWGDDAPHDPELRGTLAAFSIEPLRRAGLLERADEAGRLAILDPSPSMREADVFHDLALVCIDRGDFAGAAEVAPQRRRLRAPTATALDELVYARVCEAQGRLDEARACYTRALAVVRHDDLAVRAAGLRAR
jgi:tetratricopeptide (TPR) repeat protein